MNGMKQENDRDIAMAMGFLKEGKGMNLGGMETYNEHAQNDIKNNISRMCLENASPLGPQETWYR